MPKAAVNKSKNKKIVATLRIDTGSDFQHELIAGMVGATFASLKQFIDSRHKDNLVEYNVHLDADSDEF